MNHDDYRAVKRMNKKQLEAYLQGIFRKGVSAGVESMTAKADKKDAKSDAEQNSKETPNA